jgi:hypothetical protein
MLKDNIINQFSITICYTIKLFHKSGASLLFGLTQKATKKSLPKSRDKFPKSRDKFPKSRDKFPKSRDWT